MTDERDLLERLADRGNVRGADDVLGAARNRLHQRRSSSVLTTALAVAAVLVVAVVGVALVSDDTPTRVDTTDRDPPPSSVDPVPTTSTTTSVVSTSDGAPVFAFDIERGIVRIVEGSEPTVVGGQRGEEGETHMAVAADGQHVFHDIVATGCLQRIMQTDVAGKSEITAGSGILPAPDPTGRFLAYATGSTCTSDADVLVVRDLATMSEERHEYGDDGLETRIEDIEWVDGRIVVLARQYDGAAAASALLDLFTVGASGNPEFDGGVPDSGAVNAVPFDTLTGIEPLPGRPATLLATSGALDRRGPTTFVTIETSSGTTAEQFVVDAPVTSFAPRSADDVYYVSIEPKVDGTSAQVDRLVRRQAGVDTLVATAINSVAV